MPGNTARAAAVATGKSDGRSQRGSAPLFRAMCVATGYDLDKASHLFYVSLRERYEGGETATAIAMALGAKVSTVCQWLRAAGVQLKRGAPKGSRQSRPNARTLSILERLRSDESIGTIARDFGVSRQRISQIMHKYGIRRDDPSHRAHVIVAKRHRAARAQAKDARRQETEAYRRLIVAKAAELRDAGYNAAEQARHLGVCYNTIVKWRDAYAPASRINPLVARISEEEFRGRCEMIERMRSAGERWRTIDAALGVKAYDFARLHLPHLFGGRS